MTCKNNLCLSVYLFVCLFIITEKLKNKLMFNNIIRADIPLLFVQTNTNVEYRTHNYFKY